MREIVFSITLCLSAFVSLAQVVSTKADRTIFEAYKKQFEHKKKQSVGQLIVETGKFFLGTPYVAATLEGTQPEKVVVNLRELDCTTFVESCIALVKTVKSDKFSFENYSANLENIRYRGGHCDAYPSRLHYFSDWIYNNTHREPSPNGLILTDRSQLAGGIAETMHVNYMSTHADKYKQLKNKQFVDELKNQENAINKRTYYYIPKKRLAQLSSNIQDGDIIAITTSMKGLDIAHVGLAYWQNGQLHFIHASQKAQKVIINPETLQVYLNRYDAHTGIMLVRLSSQNQK